MSGAARRFSFTAAPAAEPGEDVDIFEAEKMPEYAKTYILPRKMKLRKENFIKNIQDAIRAVMFEDGGYDDEEMIER